MRDPFLTSSIVIGSLANYIKHDPVTGDMLFHDNVVNGEVTLAQLLGAGSVDISGFNAVYLALAAEAAARIANDAILQSQITSVSGDLVYLSGLPSTTLITSSDMSIIVEVISGGYNLRVAPPIIPLAFASFTGGATYEVGQIINSVSLAWTYNKSNANPSVSQSINQGIGGLPVVDRTYMYSTPISAGITFTISAVDATSSPTANTAVSFLRRVYWGVSPSSSLGSVDIVAGSSLLSGSKSRTITYDCSLGRHFFYAIPASYGTITASINNLAFSSWSDGVGNETPSPYQVTVTNAYLNNTLYNVYSCFYVQYGSNIQVVYT